MSKFDYSKKELLKTFSCSTASRPRNAESLTYINGRAYIKTGELQAVTAVGNLYVDEEGNKVLHIGISRQHPKDIECNKRVGFEQAQLKATVDPDIIINTVPSKLTTYNFARMMSWYVDMMELEYVMTKEEILESDPQLKAEYLVKKAAKKNNQRLKKITL